jgi:hypothetical protein
MNKITSKKLSRRDAIKLLGAATGATLLANLPSKWSKPSLMSGVLPAHAQTSGQISFVSVPNDLITCGGPGTNIFYPPQQGLPVIPIVLQTQLSPAQALFPINYQLTVQNISVNVPLAGAVMSNNLGLVALNVTVTVNDSPNQLQNVFFTPTAFCNQQVLFTEQLIG